jgi:hypothetical protein
MSNPTKAHKKTTDRVRHNSQSLSGYRTNRRIKHGGRKLGTPNKTTRELQEAVIEAAQRVGSDLNGKDGLVGYLMRVGRTDSKAFGTLLRAVLPLRVKYEMMEDTSSWTLEDYEADFRRREIPMPFWWPAYIHGDGELEALAEQLQKQLSLEIKPWP